MNIKEEFQKLRKELLSVHPKHIYEKNPEIVRKPTAEEKKMLMDFKQFREGTISPAATALANHLNSVRSIYLDEKVDDFIEWYGETMVNNKNDEVSKREMRNFIEKVAIWYELRYPSYEINRMMPGSAQEEKHIDEIMFDKNGYVNKSVDNDSEVRVFDWAEFYNTKSFIQSLPYEEKYFFARPNYPSIVYLNPNGSTHFHLSKKGIVEESEYLYIHKKEVSDDELEGKHIREVVEILKQKGFAINSNSEIYQAINNYDNMVRQKEEMLDCIMYRIIERGGDRIGPRRGLLFAKEFGRNVDIPMMYGVDRTDPGLREFVNEYIKAGGSKDLMCYVGYFSRNNRKDKLSTISIQDLILTEGNDAATFYTPEEDELHQRLVNILSTQVDQKQVKQEETKKLRIERRLKRSQKNNNQ